MAPDWMSVRVVKCDAFRPEVVGCDKGKSEKSLISVLLRSCMIHCRRQHAAL